jgi:hypothetical protein
VYSLSLPLPLRLYPSIPTCQCGNPEGDHRGPWCFIEGVCVCVCVCVCECVCV